jgi:hypothetical protein
VSPAREPRAAARELQRLVPVRSFGVLPAAVCSRLAFCRFCFGWRADSISVGGQTRYRLAGRLDIGRRTDVRLSGGSFSQFLLWRQFCKERRLDGVGIFSHVDGVPFHVYSQAWRLLLVVTTPAYCDRGSRKTGLCAVRSLLHAGLSTVNRKPQAKRGNLRKRSVFRGLYAFTTWIEFVLNSH